ncbi:MAG: hypothetical protein ABIL11_09155 [Chloroflexota bacterium]
MKLTRLLLPRIEYVILAAIFWGIAASGPKLLNADGDLPRHLLVGNLILETRSVPTIDEFSFRTTGKPSIPHEWLAQVIFAAFYNMLGLNGVVLLTALLATAVFALVYRSAIQGSSSLFAALIFTGLAVSASMIHILPRPHLFTYLLLSGWIMLLEQMRKGRSRAWWALPAVMLLWVNLHGMFVLGIIAWLIYLAGSFLDNPDGAWLRRSKVKNLLAGGLLSLPVTLLSPSGSGIWKTIFSLGSNSYITSRISEYQPANFHQPATWPFVLLLILVMIGLSRVTQKLSWSHTLLLACFAAMALYTSRMLPLFAITAAPIAAEIYANWMRNAKHLKNLSALETRVQQVERSTSGILWLIAIFSLVVLLFASGQSIDAEKKGNVFDSEFFPVDAAAWLKSNPQNDRMFNAFDWGGYLLFELWPDQQIFMDGHTHIYGEALTREYEQVITLDKGWEEILGKYQVQLVIMPEDSELVRQLESQADWQVIYADSTTVILQRR